MQRRLLGFCLALAAALLLAAPAFAEDGTIRRGIDLWRTPGDGTTYSDFSSAPIPAGFFCEDSLPFDGRIAFEGVPVATAEPGALGRTDTIVERLDDARFNRRGLAETRIQVRALSLASVSPIRTSCGLYNVMVALEGEQPVTRMRIVRTHEDGGFFVAPLSLHAKLTFTPVAGRGRETRELAQTVNFTRNPRIPWTEEVDRGHPLGKIRAIKVDTDGDLEADAELPGMSNFVAGFELRAKSDKAASPCSDPCACTIPCHCDGSREFPNGPGYFIPGSGACRHLHCPNTVYCD